jgi:hypothetical protein
LALINQGGRFSLPYDVAKSDTEIYEKAVSKRDNDLFQTARLVTSGLYISIILNDYVRTILNLQRVESTWNLDPRADIDGILGTKNIGKGGGNQVSVEFNLIYRWHSVISVRNERWLNDHMASIFPDLKMEDLTLNEMRAGIRRHAAQVPIDPGRRTFAGLERDASGHFSDEELVKILTDATEDVASSFGPRHVPIALKVVEIMGIEQARAWGMASLNEMRRCFRLKAHDSFTDINSDLGRHLHVAFRSLADAIEIAGALEALYGDIDNVELYPGVVVGMFFSTD